MEKRPNNLFEALLAILDKIPASILPVSLDEITDLLNKMVDNLTISQTLSLDIISKIEQIGQTTDLVRQTAEQHTGQISGLSSLLLEIKQTSERGARGAEQLVDGLSTTHEQISGIADLLDTLEKTSADVAQTAKEIKDKIPVLPVPPVPPTPKTFWCDKFLCWVDKCPLYNTNKCLSEQHNLSQTVYQTNEEHPFALWDDRTTALAYDELMYGPWGR